jgi:hypothetical protein
MAKNRISAVFLTALFLILCGLWPVSACLLQGGTPEDTGENRTLAAYPELKNLRDLERFPAGFEAWLNDHMPAKTALVESQSALELGLFGEMAQDKVVFGTSRPWLFNRSEDGQPLETYKRTNLFSEEELDRISQNLSEMQQDFSDAGIRMVLMISPDKEQIYGDDYMPSSVAVLENEGRTEQLIGALGKTCPSLPVVYPAELLRKGREKEEVYYASDTHWNRIGACIACGALVDTLAEDTGSTWSGAEAFRERYHFSEKEKKTGDLQKLVRLGEEFDSTEYEAQEARTAEVSDVSEDVRGEVIRERSTNLEGLPLHVYLSGDSFRWNLTGFLQDSVSKSTITSRYYLDLEDVVAQEPDVFVYMIAERYLHELDRIPGYNTQALTY